LPTATSVAAGTMRRLTVTVMAGLLLAGCATPGLIYTDITQPLTTNMKETPRAADLAVRSQRGLREPITRTGIRAEWSGYAIGQAARKGKLDIIHYADIRRQSVLGIWTRTTVEVYGVRLLVNDPALEQLLDDQEMPPESAPPPP